MTVLTSRSFLSVLSAALLGTFMACSEKPSSSSTNSVVAQPENPSNPQVEIDTSEGKIVVEIFADKAPLSAANFLSYVEKGHYNSTIFHRVIKKFMIQGGGFEDQNGNFVEKQPQAPIKNEHSNGLKNRRGTLAMARTNDPHSATSQFFVNTADNNGSIAGGHNLDQGDGYAVFGKVISGMDVVDKIEATPTGKGQLTSRVGEALVPGPHSDVPQAKVVIKSARKL